MNLNDSHQQLRKELILLLEGLSGVDLDGENILDERHQLYEIVKGVRGFSDRLNQSGLFSPENPDRPTIRNRIVDVYDDYQVQPSDRSVLVHTEDVTITLPAWTEDRYQEAKIYSITNKTEGGFFIAPSSGETIYIKNDGYTSLEMTAENVSRDFQRHKPEGQPAQWDTQ